ncbi:MAG: hypothetical protein JWP17_2185 [Solirubrobacterales bacterium]|jgi:hypothetical protein|nr:hypothetical protein [Solirubrobacterales bacterium]
MDETTTRTLQLLCEAIVPGSARVRPVAYVEAVIDAMDAPSRAMTLEAIAGLAQAAPGGADALAPHAMTPGFQLVRALAIEAFYSDFVAPGAPGPGAYAEIGFDASPLAARVKKDWSYLLGPDTATEAGTR